MDKIQERISLLISTKGMTNTEFAEAIDVQPANISHVMSGRNRPSLDLVMKIITRFPEVRTDWLLFGQGAMNKDYTLFDIEEIPVVRGRDKQERTFEKGVDSDETREILTQKGIEEEALSSVNFVKREEFSEKSLEPDNFNAGRHSDQKSGNLTSEVRSKKVEKIILFYNDKSFGEYYPESD
ncbi:MAG TPA: helix-turn-helix transcriptional regulator [Bacteroidales bacterium]|nr:helix-turn-helix transcriptional regulator [Bacteroidales bacterium]